MADSSACVFCQIIAGQLPARTVYEDADHIAFFPLEHINPGHLVLIPKQHTDYLFDLDAAAYQALWATAAGIAGPLRDIMAAKRVGVAVEGFSVPHVHVHLVPINAFDDLNPARAQALDPAQADSLHARIRAALARAAAARD
ncbi:MAG: HIT family protein [Betaproteobacteria bacterium]